MTPKHRRRQYRTHHKGRPGTKTFPTGSTRPEEVEMADKLRPSPLLMPQRRLAQSIMDTLDTANMTLAELAVAVLRALGRPATTKEVHALIAVGRPDAAYDAVNRGLQRAVMRRETGVKRENGIYRVDDGKSTEDKEATVAESSAQRVPIKNKLMEYFSRRVGETLYVGDIAKDLDTTEERVKAAVVSIRHREGDAFPVETVIPATAWIHRPAGTVNSATKGDTLFRLIGGPTKDGSYILEREDGTLYMAKEM